MLAIGDASADPDFDIAMETAAFYRVGKAQACKDLTRLREVMATWEARAKALGPSSEERAELETCIQVPPLPPQPLQPNLPAPE